MVAEIFTHQTGNLNALRLDFFGMRPVIANMGIGGHHQLPKIRGICKDLLITGHPGVKAYFTKGASGLPSYGFAVKNSAIGQ